MKPFETPGDKQKLSKYHLKKKSFSEPVFCVSVILEKPFKKGKVFVVYLTLCYILKMQNLFYESPAEPVSGLVNVNDCFPN